MRFNYQRKLIVPDIETNLDCCHRYGYITLSSLVKGAFRMPSDLRQRVRCPRAVSQTAPGRL